MSLGSAFVPLAVAAQVAQIEYASFGYVNNQRVQIYTLRNQAGMVARITNYGGIVVSLTAPDKVGVYGDVVLGFDSLEEYRKISPYFGALIGRYGTSKCLVFDATCK